ncbi:mevalonate kinase [Paramicrobacterium sp. CJ85]|uniref:mevalonate kinase n=1 Tax=Paramicrobacterium sp. CJ85 TaxID=3445355 RepID=UPI003F617580
MHQPARTAEGSAHAKTILLGEHAVVYGRPAIAFPVASLTLHAEASSIPAGLTLDTLYQTGAVVADGDTNTLKERLAEIALRRTLDHLGLPHDRVAVRVTGSIPAARGLGSSAAVAHAVAVAVARLNEADLTPAQQFAIVQDVERVAHGTPSGLDARATMADGPIWFDHGEASPLASEGVAGLVVADTGAPGRTSTAVAEVRRRREQNPQAVDSAFDEIAQLTRDARADLRDGDTATLGARMNVCHGILSELGVSSSDLDRLVQAARDAGAVGAKLTGGGQGGCIIALAPSDAEVPALAQALADAGARGVWPVSAREEDAA